MSYLIALYVYYHGNNLPFFGFVKGKDDDAPQNQGLKTPDEIDTRLVSEEIIDGVRKKEAFKRQDDWESMMKKVLLKSQEKSIMLHKRGLVSNPLLNNTSEDLIDEGFEEDGEVNLGIFNTLNHF